MVREKHRNLYVRSRDRLQVYTYSFLKTAKHRNCRWLPKKFFLRSLVSILLSTDDFLLCLLLFDDFDRPLPLPIVNALRLNARALNASRALVWIVIIVVILVLEALELLLELRLARLLFLEPLNGSLERLGVIVNVDRLLVNVVACFVGVLGGGGRVGGGS